MSKSNQTINNITFVSRKKIEYIAHNFILTTHAKKRLMQRYGTIKDVRKMLLNCILAWENTDKTINIAIDYNHYFVVGCIDGKYKIVTYNDKSKTGYTIIDKFILAYLGIDRQDYINSIPKNNIRN